MQLDPLWEGHLKVIYLECHDSACRKHSSTALDSGDHQYLDKLNGYVERATLQLNGLTLLQRQAEARVGAIPVQARALSSGPTSGQITAPRADAKGPPEAKHSLPSSEQPRLDVPSADAHLAEPYSGVPSTAPQQEPEQGSRTFSITDTPLYQAYVRLITLWRQGGTECIFPKASQSCQLMKAAMPANADLDFSSTFEAQKKI